MFDIKVCNYIFRIYPHYTIQEEILSDFIVESDHYDYEIQISKEEALYELSICQREITLMYCEFLAIYRKMTQWLLSKNCFLIHGVLLAVNEEGYLFAAKSGTGKTTHTQLWMELLGSQARIINGDKPFCYFKDGKLYGCGTPCNGKENFGTNEICQINAIGFIERDKHNSVEEMNEEQKVERLLTQIYTPTDVESYSLTLEFINQLIRQVPIYTIKCNMDLEAAQVAYATMSQNKEKMGEMYENKK